MQLAQPLATENLNLRQFKKRDAQDALTNWLSQSSDFIYVNEMSATTLSEAESIIDNYRRLKFDTDSYCWCIETAQSRIPIGYIEVTPSTTANAEGILEFAYLISPQYQNNGYATEALQAIVRHIFACGYSKLSAKIDIENSSSISVVEKCGFSLEGILRNEYQRPNGQISDACLYGLLADDIEILF